MKVKFFSTRNYEQDYLWRSNNGRHEFVFESAALSSENVESCANYQVVSVFTNDDLSATVLQKLKQLGVNYICIRATGYDHADLNYADSIDLRIANVPEYSPYSVAEHAVLLILALSRKVITAHTQLALYNYSLEHLVGFELRNKTVGIIGMGRIGATLAAILKGGFGCTIIAYDQEPNPAMVETYGVHYGSKEEVFAKADIISLHIPLNDQTHYFINKESIASMKNDVMLINTSRGGLVNTEAVIEGLKSGKIGYFGADVYEREKGIFFYDHSDKIIRDDTLLKLMSFQNVIITPHQGFLTTTALQDIAATTLYTINCWESGKDSRFEITKKYGTDHSTPVTMPEEEV